MPTTSIIAAVLTKYATLSASLFPSATRPPIAFDEMPRTNSVGVALSAEDGYVVLKDVGCVPVIHDFELSTREEGQFIFEVFYPRLADVDLAVAAIKFNGASAILGGGFDFGTLDDLIAPRVTHVITRIKETRTKELGYGRTGQLIHCCRIGYRVVVMEDT